MKECSYCGRENPDDALHCRECGTKFEAPVKQSQPLEQPQPEPAPSPSSSQHPEYEIAPLAPGERQKDFVTLVRCRTLLAADMIVARLRAGGITAFLPDENFMQVVGWNFNTFGYVRVQVTPKDYEAARELIANLSP